MHDNPEVAEWVGKAEEDYQGALALMRQRARPLPSLVCYHTQQCVEKYLKAALLFHGQSFPKTHDLIKLYELCLEKLPALEEIFEAIAVVSPYSVGARYPGTPNAVEEAQEAVEAMKQAREFFKKRLEEKE